MICTHFVSLMRNVLKYRRYFNSQGFVYVVLSCQGVRVVGDVRTFFRIFVLSTCPYSERQKFCIFFSKHTCTSRTVVLFPSLTKGRRKYSWHYCTFCTIALSAKVRKCKSASGMVCCIMEDGQDLTVQIPFPFCSLLTSSFQRRKESMLTD